MIEIIVVAIGASLTLTMYLIDKYGTRRGKDKNASNASKDGKLPKLRD